MATDPLDESAGAARSQSTQVYRDLRYDLVSGRYAPGERLKVADLAERFSVSPGAVREALSRLVPEQLVVSRDQRGFMVAPLSTSDLIDLTDLRCEIEAIALRRSVHNGSVDWEATVLASAHRLRGAPRLREGHPVLSADWARNHATFHFALVSACGSARLLSLHQQLYEHSERYRGLSVGGEAGRRNVAEEHERMVRAAVAHDADALVGEVVRHIRLTTDLIIKAKAEHHAWDDGMAQ
jgi:DNA-binding GntR family transcriptional regulator